MKLFVILFVFFHPFVTSNLIASSRDINELIDVGIRYANNNNFQLCIEYMNEVLTIDSNNFEAKQVLGSAYVKLNNELGLRMKIKMLILVLACNFFTLLS
jgi:Flp pilus assembly protein TadD